MHHPALLDRIDAHHVGVRRQGAGAGTEHHPPAGQMVQQHPAVGNHQRMVVGQRHNTGTQPNVLGSFGRGGDEHLRTGDQLVAAGVMFTEPGFVETQPIQCDHSLHVVFECRRGGLAGRVKRCDEDTEVQGAVRHGFKPDRKSSTTSLTWSGHSCCSQCPAPSIITSLYGPVTNSAVRSRRMKAPTGSSVPATNSAGTEMVAAGGSANSSQLRSMFRYQFSPPVKPVRRNSAT